MNALDSVLGWMAIGAAASLASMIWPFLRGGAGVILKLLLGPLGAIAGAVISHLIAPAESSAERLFFAAVGAIVALAFTQLAWERYARAKTAEVGGRAASRPSSPSPPSPPSRSRA
jgi:uncharacterized membrane protein YeaQ/YmgE (transglycosylase-associated protein family)